MLPKLILSLTQIAQNFVTLRSTYNFVKKYKVVPDHIVEWEKLFKHLPLMQTTPDLEKEDHYFDLANGRWNRFKLKFQIEGMVGVTNAMECYLFELSRKVINPQMTDQFSGHDRLQQISMIIEFCKKYWAKPRAFAELSVEQIEEQFRELYKQWATTEKEVKS